MIRLVMGLVLALIIGGSAACTGNGSTEQDSRSQSQPTATTSAVPAPDPTLTAAEQKLQPAALELEDLPSDWDIAQETTAGPRDLGLSFCNSDPVDVPNLGSVETVFTLGQSTLLDQILAGYPDDDAAQVVDRLRQTVDNCPNWSETAPDGSQITFRMSPLEFPDLGDQSVAFEISVEAENPVERGELVLVRRGTVLSLLIRLDIDSGGAAADPALMERAARRADEKLQQIGP